MQRLANFIGGRFVEPASGQYLDNVDPATGQAYSLVPDSDARDVDRAVEAAAQHSDAGRARRTSSARASS